MVRTWALQQRAASSTHSNLCAGQAASAGGKFPQNGEQGLCTYAEVEAGAEEAGADARADLDGKVVPCNDLAVQCFVARHILRLRHANVLRAAATTLALQLRPGGLCVGCGAGRGCLRGILLLKQRGGHRPDGDLGVGVRQCWRVRIDLLQGPLGRALWLDGDGADSTARRGCAQLLVGAGIRAGCRGAGCCCALLPGG